MAPGNESAVHKTSPPSYTKGMSIFLAPKRCFLAQNDLDKNRIPTYNKNKSRFGIHKTGQIMEVKMKKIIVLFLTLISGTLLAGIHANLNYSTDNGIPDYGSVGFYAFF